MNRKKKTLLLAGIAIVLGVCSILIIVLQKRSSTLEQDYHIENVENITKVFMADKYDQQVLLERQNDSTWIVDKQYPASQPLINVLLETLRDMRVMFPVPNSAKANIIKNLSSSSIKVEVYKKVYRINLFDKLKLFPHEKLVKTLYVGHETQDNQGTIMFLKGTERPCVVNIPGFRGFIAPRFSANAKIWRSHNIFKADVHQIESVKVEIPQTPSESFEVVRNGNSFDVILLANNERLSAFDSNRVGNLLTSFVEVGFEAFTHTIPQIEVDSIFSKGPAYILTLTEVSGKSRWVKAYPKLDNPDTHVLPTDKDDFYEVLDVDRMYGLVEGVQDTVYLQYYVFDHILRPASYFKYHNNLPH